MNPRAFWNLLKATLGEWWNDNPFRLAASLAFYTIFSLAPTLVFAVAIAGLVFSEDQARTQIARQLGELIGGEGGKAIAQVLKESRGIGGNPTAVFLSLFTLILGSTAVFAELQSALNLIWDIEVKPGRSMIKGFLRDRILSFAIVLAVGFLLLVSLLVSAALSAIQTYMQSRMGSFPWVWQIVNLVVSIGIATLLFGMIYKYLPDVKITWKDVGVGAAVTSLLFSIGKFLIGLYLGRTAVASMYGAAGSFVILLFWVYYSALICFFGAEFTQVYARRYGSQIRPQDHAFRVGRKPNEREPVHTS